MGTVLEAKDPCFKQIISLQLGSVCTAFGVTHKYGLTALCLENQLCLIHTNELLAGNVDDLFKTTIQCQTLACNEEIIVVGHGDTAIIYAYPSVTHDVPKPLNHMKAKSNVRKLLFNPTENSMIAVLSDDGNLLLIKISMSGTGFQHWAFNDKHIISFCFSPKGKQLCVGHASGDLTQLKLDLTVAKPIKGPGGKPVSLLWISTSQFLLLTLMDNEISLFQVDLHKAPAPPTYVNFGDPFISDVVDANSEAFFNINNDAIVCASTTSTEVAVLIKSEDGNWRPADIDDKRRAALPLDNYAVGGALYYNYPFKVSFSESEIFGEMPVYIVGSREGKFSCFSFVNKGALGEHTKLREGVSLLAWQSNAQSGQPQPRTGSESSMMPLTPPIFNLTGSVSFGQQQNTPSQGFGTPPQFPPPNLGKPAVDSTLLSLLSTPTPKTTAAQTHVSPMPASFLSTSTQGFTNERNQSVVKPVPFSQPSGNLFSSSGTVAPAVHALTQTAVKPEAQVELLGHKPTHPRKESAEKLVHKFRDFGKSMQAHRKTCSEHNLKFASEEEKLSMEIEERLSLKIKELEDFVDKIQQATNIQRISLDTATQKSLSQYSQLAYAESVEERNRDPNYLKLVKARPMDNASVKRFRELEKKSKYIKLQAQECRRHFYFTSYPPLKSQIASKQILSTIENHEVVINLLAAACEKLGQDLKLNSSVDDLETGLRRATLQEPAATATAVDMEELRNFLRRRNIVRLKTAAKADYSFSDGLIINREGFQQDDRPTLTIPSLPIMAKTHSISTQTDAVTHELDKMHMSLGKNLTFGVSSGNQSDATNQEPTLSTVPTSQLSIGAATNTTTSQNSFASLSSPGIGAEAEQKPTFGTPAAFGGSPFGSTPSSSSSLPSFAPASGSIFGSSVQLASFGQFAPPAQPGTGLGSPTATDQQLGFGGASVFSGSPFGKSSGFGASSPSGSIFGGVTTESAGFGQFSQQASAPSAFGGVPSPEQKQPSSQLSIAAATNTTTSPISFASLSSPGIGAEQKPTFGAPAGFGGSPFGSNQSDATNQEPTLSTAPTSQLSIGAATNTTTSQNSFASLSSPGIGAEAKQKPTFGTPAAFGGSLFGSTPSSSSSLPSFALAPASESIFGSSVQPASFGQFAPPAQPGTGLGSPTATDQQLGFGGASVFGGSPFGKSSGFGASSTSGSIFGGVTTGSAGFGQFSQQASAPSAFGGVPSPEQKQPSSQLSIGAATNTTTSPISFASLSSPGIGAEQKPTFGAPAAFGGSPFGSTPSSSSSLPSFAPAPASGSIFGSSVQPASFGQFAPPAQSGTGFGSPTATDQQPAFGGASVFGGSPFGASSGFGASSPSGSIFGGVTTGSAGFGQFSQQASAPSAFGGVPSPEQKQPSSFGGTSFSAWR